MNEFVYVTGGKEFRFNINVDETECLATDQCSTEPAFNIRKELEQAIQNGHGMPYQVQMIRLYIDTYGS